ncbi:MAG: hypothetical protein E6Q53_00030 [Candidatus Moraniibacteriota bacterium]|nr:MAG: hypothetical protein E6Q53_00030 [Candidatus Moranbacteria bacterium]
MSDKKKKNSGELFAEVFGYPVSNTQKEILDTRTKGYCRFIDGPCQKSTYEDAQGVRRPMGVCSIHHHGDNIAITCPHRLKEKNLIFKAASEFCFPGVSDSEIVLMPEVRLPTNKGRAGNIDYILVHQKDGKVVNFSGLELQTVYFSGDSMKKGFIEYMENQALGTTTSPKVTGRQHPDYRSSSKKRLLPQLIEKCPIFSTWQKKFCVAIHAEFYADLLRGVSFEQVKKEDADFAWIVVDYVRKDDASLELGITEVVYSNSEAILKAFLISPEDIMPVGSFIATLEMKLMSLVRK